MKLISKLPYGWQLLGIMFGTLSLIFGCKALDQLNLTNSGYNSSP